MGWGFTLFESPVSVFVATIFDALREVLFSLDLALHVIFL